MLHHSLDCSLILLILACHRLSSWLESIIWICAQVKQHELKTKGMPACSEQKLHLFHHYNRFHIATKTKLSNTTDFLFIYFLYFCSVVFFSPLTPSMAKQIRWLETFQMLIGWTSYWPWSQGLKPVQWTKQQNQKKKPTNKCYLLGAKMQLKMSSSQTIPEWKCSLKSVTRHKV